MSRTAIPIQGIGALFCWWEIIFDLSSETVSSLRGVGPTGRRLCPVVNYYLNRNDRLRVLDKELSMFLGL